MFTDIKDHKIFTGVFIGFEFEFYSPLSRKELANKLGKILNKKIIPSNIYHSNIKVTDSIFKLEPDYSGGKKMNELITGKLKYFEAINILIKVYKFINEYGFTNEKCGVHINISLNEFSLDLKCKTENLNIFKFILNFDEDEILKMFPNKDSIQKIYKNSVYYIFPRNKMLSNYDMSTIENMNHLDFIFPKSKYFGINFNKLSSTDGGYLEVRYIGGKDYQKKLDETIKVINYTILKLYEVLSNNYSYSQIEKNEISIILKKQKDLLYSIKTPDIQKFNYKDLKIYVDLIQEPHILNLHYDQIRNKLIELMLYGNVKNGILNYDTNTNKLQVKDVTIKNGFMLNDFEFFDCQLEGDFENCKFHNCKINSSRIINSDILTNNEIKKSYIKDCFFNSYDNNIKDCFLSNEKNLEIRAKIERSIVRGGNIGLNTKIDDETELSIIESEIETSLNDKKSTK